MSLKFCANLNFLFCENSVGHIEKYRLAAAAGFKGVEGGIPSGNSDVSIDDVVNVKNQNGLEQILLNLSSGTKTETQFGCTAIPKLENDFQNLFGETVTAAKKLKCKIIHLMAGRMTRAPYEMHLETYVKNLKYAANVFETEGIIGVIEPINKYALPGYFLDNYETAIAVIDLVKSPNIKLMMDIFHLQHIKGNITNSIKELMPHVGHIQIAQIPHRYEPNVPGELDFKYIFKAIEESGYQGWIGCEYKPKDGTEKGLSWIIEMGYSL